MISVSMATIRGRTSKHRWRFSVCSMHSMAGLDPAIQRHSANFIVLPWMAASEGGHDVKGIAARVLGRDSEWPRIKAPVAV